MKINYSLLILFFISFTAFSQDKKVSVEFNYPIELTNEYEKVKGIAGGGIKYRFINSELFSYGASFTVDYLKDNYFWNEPLTYLYFHINAFAEMTIPTAEKIHPFAGAGYTLVNYDSLFIGSFQYATQRKNDYGFNLKFGIQYDFTNSFFVQSYFHYIQTYNESFIEGQVYNDSVKTKQVKFGLGYRF